ncbi:unnamed protein product [Urochloa decumbens]|uniref:Gnk2-homologous domain-containing protein n=1 Tax=Urochloa decumbens TaxID=240449 RepID=A0ABC9GT03_9POAL
MAALLKPTVLLLLLSSSVAAPAGAAADEVSYSYVGKAGLFTLLDCGPSDVGDSVASKNASAGDLSELLGAIPSVAAPEGLGHLSRGGASVRGVCVGESSFSPESCRACLIDAAWSLTKGCGLAARRAGAWSNHCFVAYDHYDGEDGGGGANGTSTTAAASKVLCHGDLSGLYADTVFKYAAFPDQTLSSLATDLTVRAVAQCARDRTEAECLRCLQASARQAAASCGGDWSGWVHGGHVLTYGCYLRFAVSSAPATGGVFILRWVVVGAALAVAALHLHG